MSTLNSISNWWSTYWHLHPASHLNKDGSVKDFSKYRHEVKQNLTAIYEEHEKLVTSASKGFFANAFNKLGKVLALKYSFAEFKKEYIDNYISPVSHYNDEGYLKSMPRFKVDLEEKLDEIYAYHKSLQAYDESTYVELTCNKIGESLSDLFSANITGTIGNATAAVCYGTAGTVKATYEFGKYIGLNYTQPLNHQVDLAKDWTIVEHPTSHVLGIDSNMFSVSL